MRSEYLITLDTHCRTSDACVKTGRGKLVARQCLPTSIPTLLEFIRQVPRPRRLCFEEGPLAGWLCRNLAQEVDELVVSDPRRNAYVGKDGDKDDPIDAEKLNDLYRANLIRPVHQSPSAERAGFKQLVGAYHTAVRARVSRANCLLALGKRWGLMWKSSTLLSGEAAEALTASLRQAGASPDVELIASLLSQGLKQAAEAEETLARRLRELARGSELMRRLMEVPGYGPVRVATLVAYLDTPWRFHSREALWKYCGIGLRRQHSGGGPEYVCVEQACNRTLRGVVLGAAQRAIRVAPAAARTLQGSPREMEEPDSCQRSDHENVNVFAERYARWLSAGLSPHNARRNVARLMIQCVWSMWKSGESFNPARLSPEPPEDRAKGRR